MLGGLLGVRGEDTLNFFFKFRWQKFHLPSKCVCVWWGGPVLLCCISLISCPDVMTSLESVRWNPPTPTPPFFYSMHCKQSFLCVKKESSLCSLVGLVWWRQEGKNGIPIRSCSLRRREGEEKEECEKSKSSQTCQGTNWKCQFHFGAHQLSRLWLSRSLLFHV